jgi:carboxypeptidase C (cathepsin A)
MPKHVALLVLSAVLWLGPVHAQQRPERPPAPAQPPATQQQEQQQRQQPQQPEREPQERPSTQPPAPTRPPQDEPGGQPPRRWEFATSAEDKLSRTSHSLRIDGREIKYTATAGTLPIRLEDGTLAARMFFVAYTRDGEDTRTRPVSFLYNGGPGSATIWLHMGSFAPRRVQMAEEGFQPAPPFNLVDNEHSLLDASDLVFVDAISTGYSRTVAGIEPTRFHGVRGDLQAFGEFIRTYLDTFSRWRSPKFLIGESYGSIRSAGLAQELQTRHGVELNGIVLVSALLSYQTLSPAPQNDIAYVTLIPTYAATAWYHKKLPSDLASRGIKAVVDEARTFAFGDYAQALVKGNTLTDAEMKSIAQKLARYTGLSPDFILRSNLRVSAGRYRKELLRDQRLSVGRLDSRFTAVDLDAAGEQQEFDPSNTALQGAYTALFSDYVRNELKWETNLHYPTSGNVRPWNWGEFENRYMDMTDALRQTMARNPFLRVFVTAGYYDMATPLGGIEYNVWHLGYDRTFVERVSFGYYEGGHMMYIRPSAHKSLKDDVARFIRASSAGPKITTTSAGAEK